DASDPMALRTLDAEERRARLGRRQLLEPTEAASIEELIDRLVVLHATDPATIYLSVAARRPGVTVADIDAALFERRTIYRALAMRRTLFVASRSVGPAVEGSSSPRTADQERKRLEKFLVDTGISDPEDWLASLFDEVGEALGADDGGVGRPARALVAEIPRLATKLIAGIGTRQEMELSATSRVLGLMAVEGLLVRGRPSGGWTGRQYSWHRRDRWWPDGTEPTPIDDEHAAAVDLLGRYIGRFGPVTLTDLAWWTGWTKTKTRAVLADVETAEVLVETEPGGAGPGGRPTGDGQGEPAFVLADDAEPIGTPEPLAALLPSLDPTPMGWKQRHWYLGPHQGPLFDRNGNIGPTVWLDGRIVGGWSQRADGQVVTELFDDVGADGRALIETEVGRIQAFVGDVVVKPSFPTPLQKELSAS
ncbi:MAG: winged helix DNA-binding domain-containing protein, partial [Actinomycetota bacterium]